MSRTLDKTGSILIINGLDISAPADYIGEQSSPNVQNFRVIRSLLAKRVGTTLRGDIIGGTNVEIMGGREFTREGALYNVRVGREKIEYYDPGTTAWVDATGSNLTGTTNDLVDIAIPLLSGKQIICVTNGVDSIQKWTGSSTFSDLGGSPPKAKFIQEYKTYLVCANITGGVDISTRVQWSDTADPETWSGGNAGAKDLVEDGEDITGLSLFGDYLCVHKRTSIYVGYLVSSTEVFRFERKSTEVGTIANGSIINLPTGEQIFLSYDGIRVFNGVSAPLVPSRVNEEIRDGLNLDAAHKAWGCLVLENDEAWIGVPIGSQLAGETVYKYNYKTGAMHKDTRSGANCAWRATETDALSWDSISTSWDDYVGSWNSSEIGASSTRIHIGTNTGYTYISDNTTYNDAGTAIDAIWDSKDFTPPELGRIARWMELLLWARGTGSLHVYYSIDEGNTFVEAGDSPLTLSADFPEYSSPQKIYFDQISTHFRIRYRMNGTGDYCEIKQFALKYKVREII